ncbi:ABC transporter permease subunit [Corynebacterium durum]|uniref:ABC transporter permease subunit n=1 Tax=Corynebacterium durum TaxID=61592 RepID=UPI0017B58A5C|nr:ABC transporter permease subunit [Corynebacterium durum]NYI73530.1 peptide/nickel transport system permease protein [Corynebacterium durum]WJY85254.1 putative D,D-dipeptide transport system permease protein DdpC [Corynebacterium durum]
MPTRPFTRFSGALTSLLLVASSLLITALLPWLGNRDLALAVFRAREAERDPDPEILEAIRTELDLPTNPAEGVMEWLRGAITGDFGVSWVDPSRNAADVALGGFGVSFTLAALSTGTAVILSWFLVWPRLRSIVRGTATRSSDIMGMALLGTIPEFVLAVVLLVLFALRLRIFPVSGFSSYTHMVLPTLALALPSAGLLGRVLLITIDGIGREEWVRVWRRGGVSPRQLYRAISIRAAGTIAPQVVLFLAGTLASTALVEQTFNIAGLGRSAVTAALDQDVPVLQVIVLTMVIVGIVAGSAAHWLRMWILGPLLKAQGNYASYSVVTARPHGTIPFLVVCIPFLSVLLAMVLTRPTLDVEARLQAPSAQHWLGTDQLGRDLLARLADGMVYTIGASILVTAICALLGFGAGLSGRWAARLGDTLNALPIILVGLVLAGVFGRSIMTAAIAVIVVGWIPLAAHTSTVAAEIRKSGYYTWAQLQGASRTRLVWWHLVPNVLPAVVRHAASRVAHNALALAGLGFLGLGAPHDSPEWGVVLSESIRYAERAPWMMAAPTVMLMLLGVAAALATDTTIRLRWKT